MSPTFEGTGLGGLGDRAELAPCTPVTSPIPAPQQVLTCTFLPGERGGCGRDRRASWLLGARRHRGTRGRKGRRVAQPQEATRRAGWLLGHTHRPPVLLKARRQRPVHRGGPAGWSSE